MSIAQRLVVMVRNGRGNTSTVGHHIKINLWLGTMAYNSPLIFYDAPLSDIKRPARQIYQNCIKRVRSTKLCQKKEATGYSRGILGEMARSSKSDHHVAHE